MPQEPDETTPDPGFDGRMARLEEIVAQLEEGGLGLEPAIEHYREGVSLLKGCRDLLGGYRRQVEELTREAEGGLRPYAGDPDVPGRRPPGESSQSAGDRL